MFVIDAIVIEVAAAVVIIAGMVCFFAVAVPAFCVAYSGKYVYDNSAGCCTCADDDADDDGDNDKDNYGDV